MNFPFICSNIPAAPAYGVSISQMIRYSRACGSYQDFLDRGLLLTKSYCTKGYFWWSWCHHFENVPVVTMTWLTAMEYLCHKWPRSFPHSRLITGFVTRLTRRVSLVEQELLTLPEHLSSPPVFSGVHVTRYLVLYVCFVERCLSFCTFCFDHRVVSSSSIYRYWLLLWYLQTLLTMLGSVNEWFSITPLDRARNVNVSKWRMSAKWK